MIKGIIFDCFGVLATDSWIPFKDKHFGDDPAKFEAATALNERANEGEISYTEFIAEISKLAGVPSAQTWRQIENNPANEPLFEYIAKELKPSFKIGLLSNAAANWLNELFSQEQVALFDAISLSFEDGFIKPDPKAYETIAQKLALKPSECVLVDDQPRHCEGAKTTGMPAILYQSTTQLKRDLDQTLNKR